MSGTGKISCVLTSPQYAGSKNIREERYETTYTMKRPKPFICQLDRSEHTHVGEPGKDVYENQLTNEYPSTDAVLAADKHRA
jgi:hypothetical protein